MRIGLVGNFEPTYSTENEYLDAWGRAGHEAFGYQEGSDAIHGLLFDLRAGRLEMVQWTSTKGLRDNWGEALQWEMLRTAGKAGIPVVGVHLDIWHGLERETSLRTEAYFRGVDLMLTANGDPEADWEQYGITHEWLPPGVSERWCHEGKPRPEFTHDIASVGSWQGGYHHESVHRHELVKWLRKNYPGRVGFYPEPGQHAVRGDDLTDLYWSCKVVVGDSCSRPDLSTIPNYCSDRIPETLGRGGVLIHPATDGIDRLYEKQIVWEMGDWDELRDTIEATLQWHNKHGEAFINYRRESIHHILDNHTYTVRCGQIIEIMKRRGLL